MVRVVGRVEAVKVEVQMVAMVMVAVAAMAVMPVPTVVAVVMQEASVAMPDRPAMPMVVTHGRAEEGRVIVALVQPTVVMARQPVVAEPQVMQVRPVAPRMPPLAAAARLPRPAVRQATALMAWVVRRPVVMAWVHPVARVAMVAR